MNATNNSTKLRRLLFASFVLIGGVFAQSTEHYLLRLYKGHHYPSYYSGQVSTANAQQGLADGKPFYSVTFDREGKKTQVIHHENTKSHFTTYLYFGSKLSHVSYSNSHNSLNKDIYYEYSQGQLNRSTHYIKNNLEHYSQYYRQNKTLWTFEHYPNGGIKKIIYREELEDGSLLVQKRSFQSTRSQIEQTKGNWQDFLTWTNETAAFNELEIYALQGNNGFIGQKRFDNNFSLEHYHGGHLFRKIEFFQKEPTGNLSIGPLQFSSYKTTYLNPSFPVDKQTILVEDSVVISRIKNTDIWQKEENFFFYPRSGVQSIQSTINGQVENIHHFKPEERERLKAPKEHFFPELTRPQISQMIYGL